MFLQSITESPYRYGPGPTPAHPLVILCGGDPMLLWTRKLVLEHAGLSVQTILGIEGLDKVQGVALVLCYTLSDDEKAGAIQMYRTRHPGAKILLLGSGRIQSGKYCETFNDYHYPQRFLEKVRQLVFA